MLYGVELFFAPPAEADVRRVQAALHAAGLPALTSRPHVTLGVAGDVDLPGLTAAVQQFARTSGELTLHFHGLGIFAGTEGVLYLAVTPAACLLALHEAFHVWFDDYAYGRRDYYLPGNWVPHCTLAQGATTEQLARATAVILPLPWPQSAAVHAVGIAAVEPARTRLLAHFAWGSGEALPSEGYHATGG